MTLAAARRYHSRHHRSDDDRAHYGMLRKERVRHELEPEFRRPHLDIPTSPTYPMQNHNLYFA